MSGSDRVWGWGGRESLSGSDRVGVCVCGERLSESSDRVGGGGGREAVFVLGAILDISR